MPDTKLRQIPSVIRPPKIVDGEISGRGWTDFILGLHHHVLLIAPGVHTFTSTDATPSVKGVTVCKTAGTTAITDFDDGIVGQTIHILATASITITDGSPIILNGSADYTMTVTDTLVLTMYDDQVWQEDSRSVN